MFEVGEFEYSLKCGHKRIEDIGRIATEQTRLTMRR